MGLKNEEFGPRPETLWVGMRGVNGRGDMLTVKSIGEEDCTAYCSRVEWAKGEIGEVGYLSYCTAYTGKYWGDRDKWAAAEDIVEWEQPATGERSEAAPEEPDWKAKYEQLQREVANLIDCRAPYAELRRKYLRLKAELEQTQAELNDVYKDREKLNKIVNLLNEE